MKSKFLNIFIFIFLIFSLVGCSGEQGPIGPQGEQGIQGEKGEPGEQGEEGKAGLSAYEIFLKYHPEYTGSEEEWINDVAMGNKCNLFGHEWDEGIITSEPTKGNEGEKTYTCMNCDEHKYEVLPKIEVADAEIYEVDGIKYVNYGSYPQTHVGDETLIAELNKLTTTNDRGYYEYNGNEYAKVTTHPCNFNYGSYNDEYGNLHYYTYSDKTVIQKDVIEWFLVEPIKWRIISKNIDGSYSLYSECILDSVSFCNYNYLRKIDGLDVYRNNYKFSNIRAWLNGYDGTDYKIADYTNVGFYDKVFSKLEKNAILTTEVDNSASTTDSPTNQYACENTLDKIYLLSYKDLKNSNYGFTDAASRCAKVTDYAKAVGADWYTSTEYLDNGCYWMRSPSFSVQTDSGCVCDDGDFYYHDAYGRSGSFACDGVRVACTVNLDVTESGKEPDNEDYKNLISEIKKDIKNQGIYDEGKYNFIFSVDTSENYMYTGIIEYDPSSDELSIYYASLKNDESEGSSVTIYIPNEYNSDYLFDYKYVSTTVNNEGIGEFYAPTFTSSSSVDFSLHSGDWSEYVSSTYCALLISMALDNFANSSTYDMSVLGFNNYNY